MRPGAAIGRHPCTLEEERWPSLAPSRPCLDGPRTLRFRLVLCGFGWSRQRFGLPWPTCCQPRALFGRHRPPLRLSRGKLRPTRAKCCRSRGRNHPDSRSASTMSGATSADVDPMLVTLAQGSAPIWGDADRVWTEFGKLWPGIGQTRRDVARALQEAAGCVVLRPLPPPEVMMARDCRAQRRT